MVRFPNKPFFLLLVNSNFVCLWWLFVNTMLWCNFMGGIYEVLKIMYQQLECLSNTDDVYFTSGEIQEMTGLSSAAVSRNLTNLTSNGLIEKVAFRKKDKRGLFTKYKIKGGDTIDFIKSYIFD